MTMTDPQYPAFPFEGGENNGMQPTSGITIRDYFAAKAMQAFIATAAEPCLNGLDGYEVYTARAAYKMADEMIKESDK